MGLFWGVLGVVWRFLFMVGLFLSCFYVLFCFSPLAYKSGGIIYNKEQLKLCKQRYICGMACTEPESALRTPWQIRCCFFSALAVETNTITLYHLKTVS